jgi:type VI secretion system protein ImpF
VARADSTRILRPSIVDRLVARPGEIAENRYFEGISARELKASVARDLAWLLNTRVWIPSDDETLSGLGEAGQSILTYGIPDLASYSWTNPQDCREIAAVVEKAIRTFEPRLLPRSVRVEILPNDDVADFTVRLRIEAILHVDPINEHVAFDSTADLDGGGIRIESFE